MEPTVPSIIEEMEQYKPIPYATKWQRFASFLIDIGVYYIASGLVGGMLSILTVLLQVDLLSFLSSKELNDQALTLLVVCPLIMFTTYFLSEGLSKGYTLGKLITGTRAVKENNSPVTWKDAAYRSLVRLIPLEPLSIINYDGLWHDSMSKTMVVKTRGV